MKEVNESIDLQIKKKSFYLAQKKAVCGVSRKIV
jgi:hypothetical protein